jgi:hypothetical protein
VLATLDSMLHNEQPAATHTGLAVGLALGAGFGLLLGLLMFDSPALGLGLGMALGIAVGAGLDGRRGQSNESDDSLPGGP